MFNWSTRDIQMAEIDTFIYIELSLVTITS